MREIHMVGGNNRNSADKRRNRRRAQHRGHLAEHVAAISLRLKGYRILQRRFRCPRGEIDLIARRGTHFAFIEVKARQTRNIAREAVRQQQRRRIVQSADVWLARAAQQRQLPVDYSVSFDVMLVTPWQWPKHLQAAFDVPT